MSGVPEWARWRTSGVRWWTLGVEEEVMLLDPGTWRLAQAGDDVLPALSPELAASVSAETHAAALELSTGVHATVGSAVRELRALRGMLDGELRALGWRTAAAGTHPTTSADETRVSGGVRYQLLHGSMRALARREPTFAVHVHVGVPDPDAAIDLAGRMRGHLPLLLALSANSPFVRGADTGLASARTPLFQAFPRAGLPRRFGSYRAWVDAVAPLIAADAIPEPTFLWWDVRVQPRLGTVEVRIMDAQTSLRDVAALVALTQSLAALEVAEHYLPETVLDAHETLDENRFLAARDGMAAEFVDPRAAARVPARTALREAVAAARGHAERLGCLAELDLAVELAATPPAERQRALGGTGGPSAIVAWAADAFTSFLVPVAGVAAAEAALP